MSQEKQWMLRVISPSMFEQIRSELEKYNVHPNDIQAKAIEKNDGLEVTVLFGEGFNQSKAQFFTNDAIETDYESIQRFAYDIAEACREVMIADYYKMMKM